MICSAYQLSGFYMIGLLPLNGLVFIFKNFITNKTVKILLEAAENYKKIIAYSFS